MVRGRGVGNISSIFCLKVATWISHFWGKIFSNCKFLGFSSVIPQNKFLVVKFMTKIGQKKTSGNCFQKLKNLESSECWPKLYKTMLNWKLLMLTHLSMKIVTHIFGYEICSIPNIFRFKIFNESILLGFNWILHMHTPSPLGQQGWTLPEWTSKKLNELLWVSLNSMYGLKYQWETNKP